VSPRPRRALVGLITALAALALPAAASAAESLSVSPSSLQAGGNPTITATLGFAPGAGDTPKTVVTSLAPGLLSNLNANPSCLASMQLTAACQIGNATSHTTAGDITGNLYLVPPQGSDAAGIEYVPSTGASQYVGVSLNPSTPGSLNVSTTFPQVVGVQVTGFTATFNPTLNGQPFTRLPSSCSPATSTMNVTYYGSTPSGSASGSFTPSGCGTLPYAPNVTASITKDKNDDGAALVIGITQAAGESASKSIVLNTPKGLTPNLGADVACLAGTPCNVGTATATSPLVPSPALAHGTVSLGGSATAPTITIAFPAPFAITLTGTLSLTSDAVTFANVPDVPLTSLTVSITGPNGQKAFNTDCKPANFGGSFTAQSGATHTATAAVTFTGCPVKPTATGSTSGLASGQPKLKFKIAHGKSGPNVAAVTIGLPGGLGFSRSAIVSHKTCTTQGKKKCTTTTLISGLGISGGKAKSVAIRGGTLVLVLKKAVRSVTITVSGPLVTETKGLQTKVKRHKVNSLKFTLKVTDAKHTSTTLPLKLKAH
jgi:hypothetical protein